MHAPTTTIRVNLGTAGLRKWLHDVQHNGGMPSMAKQDTLILGRDCLVNPPGDPRASYYSGPEPGGDPDEWLSNATEHAGSWWEVWADWVTERAGEEQLAPSQLGSAASTVISAAPGDYVLERPSA